MGAQSDSLVLKASAARSVRRVGATRVVKSFHAASALGRLRDGQRARRELAALETLRQAGLPAPRPLGVERGDRGWELHMEWVPGARPLDQVLDRGDLSRARQGRLAGRLGRLLADLELARLHHRDLHAGNVLVDGDDVPWLVDAAGLQGARRRRGGLGPTQLTLITLASGVRESSQPSFRRRFLEAWWEASPTAPNAERSTFAEDLESRARDHRRRHVQGRLDRWLRESGATAPFQEGRSRGIKAKGPQAEGLVSMRLPQRRHDDAVAAWRSLATLVEHHLPCWTPLRLEFAPEPALTVGLPKGTHPLEGIPVPRRFGELIGALHDRGLRVPTLQRSDLAAAPDGTLLLGPVEMVPLEPERRDEQWRHIAPWSWEALPAAAQRAFLLGYLGAQRGGIAEHRRLRGELGIA